MANRSDGMWHGTGMTYVRIAQYSTSMFRYDMRHYMAHTRVGLGQAKNFRHMSLKSTIRLEMYQSTVHEKTSDKHASLVG